MDTSEGFAQHREWERTLWDAGWSVINWPRVYGGRDATLVEWLLFEEEYYLAGAPGRITQNGIFLLAPTLLSVGSDEQKERVLRRMGAAEDIWAQAWSEPESGSDLASLRSFAVRTDGGWLLSGQKTWTTRGAFADWAFGLFRTDPESSRHHGLTYFMFPLRAEGVTVAPVRRLDGALAFADVFLDQLFVPDDDVIGEVDAGWDVAMATTTSERGATLRSPGRFVASSRDLAALYVSSPESAGETEAAIVDCLVDATAYRARTFSVAGRALAGAQIGSDASIDKLFWSDLDLRIHQAAIDVSFSTVEVDRQPWIDGFVFALAGPIYAGTNEIQRNIVAQRILGLPRA